MVAGIALLLATFAAGYLVGASAPAAGSKPVLAAGSSQVAVVSTPAPGSLSTSTPASGGSGAATPTGSASSPASTSQPDATPTPVPATDGPAPSTPPGAPADFAVFWQAYQLLKDNYVDPSKLTDQNLTYGAIRGMLEAVGDTGHTGFLTPDEVAAEQQYLDGTLTGIGVLVNQRVSPPVVVSVFDGTPAAAAGIRVGDTIVAIDGKSVSTMSADQVVSSIRGSPGTTVTLTVQHAGQTGTVDIPIVRAKITVPVVTWAMVPGTTIADIRVTSFSTGAGAAVKQAIQDATAAGAQKIVLDLRGNPGGYVTDATDIASQFVGSGTIYQEKDRSGTIKSIPPNPGGIATQVPLVVLVDQGSASASEIVSGAIQGNQRAKVVGATTMGTGTEVLPYPLSDGSVVRIGFVEWLTPTGQSIFGRGITPDVPVALPTDGSVVDPSTLKSMSADQFASSKDTQLQRAVQLLGG